MAAGSMQAEAQIEDLFAEAIAQESAALRAAPGVDPPDQEETPESLLDEATEEEDAEEDGHEVEGDEEPTGEAPGVTGELPTDGEIPEGEGVEADPKVAAWAELLVKNPRNLTQIPQAKRADAIAGALRVVEQATGQRVTDAATQALITIRDRSYQEGYERARVEAEVKADFDYLEELEEDDPQAFSELGRKEPARVRRFYQLREDGTFSPPAQQPQGQGLDPESERELARVGQLLKQHPGVQARLAAKQQAEPGRYAPSTVGFARLIADTEAALAAVQAEEARQKEEPARAAAEKRQAGAANLRSAPKAPGGSGGAPRGSVPKNESLDDVLGRVDWSSSRRK